MPEIRIAGSDKRGVPCAERSIKTVAGANHNCEPLQVQRMLDRMFT
jgi:hypothetical protein